MNAVPFDTLKLAKALREASFSPEQAEGAARAIADTAQADLATRTDLDVLRRDMAAGDAAIRAEVEGLRQDGKAESASIQSEINAARADLLRSQMTTTGVQTLVILARIVAAVMTLLRLR